MTRTTPLTLQINWGARSRALNAPASALSAKVILQKAIADGSDFSWTINRNANLAAHNETYTSIVPVKVGKTTLQAEFRAEAGGSGAVVGTAAASVTVTDNGGGIGDIVTAGTVASVEIAAGQTLTVGQTAQLTAAVRDAGGALLAVSPGSLKFSVGDGGDTLQVSASGEATALKAGTAAVTAAADGKTSAAQTVTVKAPPANIGISISPQTVSVVAGKTQTFAATVTGTENAAVTYSVQEGAAGGTITAAGVYTAPNQSGSYHVAATSQADSTKTAIAAVTITPATGGAVYSVIDLGTLPVGDPNALTYATDINNNSEVVGYISYSASGVGVAARSFLWRNGVMTDLGTLPGISQVIARSVNDAGQVVGILRGENASGQWMFRWENGVLTKLNELSDRDDDTQANSINNAGVIAGEAFVTDGTNTRNHGFLWQNQQFTEVGYLGSIPTYTHLYGLNNSGQAVGQSVATRLPDYYHAVLWSGGVLNDLGTLPGKNSSVAYGINDNGQIVGVSRNKREDNDHAFLYQNGQMTELPAFPGGTLAAARAINNQGQIVGNARQPIPNTTSELQKAVLWQDGQPLNLETLAPPPLGQGYIDAVGINNRGEIIVRGGKAYLLRPL